METVLHVHASLRHHCGQLLQELDLLPPAHQPTRLLWRSLWLWNQQGESKPKINNLFFTCLWVSANICHRLLIFACKKMFFGQTGKESQIRKKERTKLSDHQLELFKEDRMFSLLFLLSKYYEICQIDTKLTDGFHYFSQVLKNDKVVLQMLSWIIFVILCKYFT